MKDQTKIIAALLAGAAAGAVLGLLLAPEKGEGLRSDIADYVNDLVASAKNRMQSAVGDLKEYGSSTIDRVRSKIYNEAEDAKDHIISEAHSKVKATAKELSNSI